MADESFAVDRRRFMIASAVGIATAAGCSSTGDSGSNGSSPSDDLEPVDVGYGGRPVTVDTEPDDPEETEPTDDPQGDEPTTPEPDDDGGGGGYGSGGGGYGPGGGGSGPGGDGGDDPITYVVVDGVLYGAPYDGQDASDIPYDDPEDDPCLGYGHGPYGGVVEEGTTPECREIDA